MQDRASLGQAVGTVEVRVHQYGLIRAYEWCTTEAEAVAVADMWSRERGVHCDIVTLAD